MKTRHTITEVSAVLDWDRIDTVLLDMDGTLLDLRFDAVFWLEHMPRHFARHHGLPDAEARQRLDVLFAHSRKKLEYYCLDWWCEQTDLDMVTLKHELVHLIRFRPTAEDFLRQVRASGRQAVIVTNAHRDGLDLKHRHTGIIDQVDQVISAHDYRVPKEEAAFWQHVREELGLQPERAMLVDDNLDALAAAGRSGVSRLFAVTQPDSGAPPLTGLPYPDLPDFAVLGAPPTREPGC